MTLCVLTCAHSCRGLDNSRDVVILPDKKRVTDCEDPEGTETLVVTSSWDPTTYGAVHTGDFRCVCCFSRN